MRQAEKKVFLVDHSGMDAEEGDQGMLDVAGFEPKGVRMWVQGLFCGTPRVC